MHLSGKCDVFELWSYDKDVKIQTPEEKLKQI